MMLDARGQYAAAMGALTAARTEQMLDVCTVVRPGEQPQTPVLDDNGDPVGAPVEAVYAGRCTVSEPTRPASGAQTLTEQSGVPNTRVLKLPHTAALRPGDLVVIDSSEFSPGLVNDEFTVLGEDERSFATYRKYVMKGSSWLTTGSTTGSTAGFP